VHGETFIDNTSFAMGIYDVVGIIVLGYTALFGPFEIAFDSMLSKANVQKLFIANVVADAFFVVDIIVCFFRPFMDHNRGTEIRLVEDIALNYLKNLFVIDFVSTIPFDIIVRVLNTPGELRLVRM
jgi:hypothetical protein